MNILDDILNADYLILFLTIGLGLMLGNIKIGTFSLGSSAVIIMALGLGYIYSIIGRDFIIPDVVRNMGLVLFIYSIGIQAGPSFVNTIKKDGIKFISLGIMPPIMSGALILLIWKVTQIDKNLLLGVLTGAMTSTPGLAAAQEATKSDLAVIGYGISYPLGTIGIVLLIKLIPKIFKINLQKEQEKHNKEVLENSPEMILKKYKIQNNAVVGMNLKQLDLRKKTHCSVSRILKNNKNVVSATAEIILEKGDILSVVGTKKHQKEVSILLGEEVNIEFPQNNNYDVRWFLVTEKKVLNKTLDKLRLKENFGAGIIRVRRSGIEIEPEKTTKLRVGDKVQVSYKKDRLAGLERFFGDSMKKLNSVSFIPISIGIVLGIILGFIPFKFGQIELKLGITGGVLLMAVFLGHRGKIGGVIWYLPGTSMRLLRTLGLLLFLVPVGFSGGMKLNQVLSEYGFSIFIIGIIVTFVTPLICTIVAKYIYKINMLACLGILSAGMTSTPDLGSIDGMIDSNVHKLSYATTYPFALLSIVFVIQALALF